MSRTLETISDAREAARAAVAYLGEEERWALLQKWLARETGGKGKVTERSPRLEALRSIVCPRVGDREWDKVVREHRRGHWAQELRLANTLALRCAGGLSQPITDTPELGAPP